MATRALLHPRPLTHAGCEYRSRAGDRRIRVRLAIGNKRLVLRLVTVAPQIRAAVLAPVLNATIPPPTSGSLNFRLVVCSWSIILLTCL